MAEPGATRRRGAALEEAILQAAWEVLVQDGYQGFTYEAVAARAGTSRPVLYRRWPQRDDLLLATLQMSWTAHPIKLPDTGRLRDDAIAFLRNANTARARSTVLVGAQLMDWFRATGSSFASLRATLRQGAPSAFQRLVDRAVERGELPPATRAPRIVDLPFDLFRYELFTTLRPVPEDTLVEIVDVVWLPLLRAAEPTRTSAPARASRPR
jgi:AcrR family transcriptional regulator